MRLDVKRKLILIGASFVITLCGIYCFINQRYIDYKLNKIIEEKNLKLESEITKDIKLSLEELNNNDFNKKDVIKNFSIYEFDGGNVKKVQGELNIDKNILFNVIKAENNIGMIINEEKLLLLKKNNNLIFIKEIDLINNQEDISYDYLPYGSQYLNFYNEVNINSELLDIKLLEKKDNKLDKILLIEDFLNKKNYISLKVSDEAISYNIVKQIVRSVLFIYAVISLLFIILLFKIINKEFFHKIQCLENRIKGILGESDKPKKIIKNLNTDSIDYIENNIDTIISSVHEYKEIVNYYSKYDSLTTLINRETFIKEGDIEIGNEKVFALIYINLDGFSYYNNNFGYVKGDEILREVSRTILKYGGSNNMVARIGGDEFAILIKDKKIFNDLQNYTEKLIEKINEIKLHDKESFVSASIGIAIKNKRDKNTTELINNAYLAMISVKENGKNSYEVFTASHKKEITIDMIQKALYNGDIQIHYQPKVNIKKNEVDGVEALVRWFDKEKGYISPMDFIKVAEDTGFIITFGDWVFRNAVRDIKKMNDELGKEISVAINVSPIQFMQKNFVGKIKKILIEEDMNPKNVEIELTESIGIFNSKYVVSIFEQLSELGISVAIDDFGTGYSSLKYLKEFKISTIKIDKTFIQGGDKNISIIKYIIDVSKILGFSVVAEGVEEYRQAKILKNLRCDYIQGYFFYKPMAIQKLYEVVKNDETIIIN
ncbi:putative bifunctional diguanylate cyclase/phosphodiesterase [Clostridium sp.]|uniref:putative bifunctional diguanylate cyclase/phosphodiesterase n=1 Tax=Clostridium sp. TaxID=1506 RepID=UPI00399679A3